MGESEWKMFPREWIGLNVRNHQVASDPSCFTIITYNILNDDYIGDNYRYCPEPSRYLRNLRHPRILEEIRTVNPDIICFQEAHEHHWRDHLQPDVRHLGYDTVYSKSADGKQGLAICYKKDKFKLLEEKNYVIKDLAEGDIKSAALDAELENDLIKYMNTARNALYTHLHHHGSKKTFWLCNFHATWGGLQKPTLQTLQISCAARQLLKLSQPENEPHILCGDFNTPAHFPAYSLLSTGNVDCQQLQDIPETLMSGKRDEDDLKLVELSRCLPEAFTLPNRAYLTSAYMHVMGAEPEVTSSDDGESPGTPCELCLDYLWYDNQHMTSQAVLATPPRDVIMGDYSLPSVRFPSDHIPLAAQFSFT